MQPELEIFMLDIFVSDETAPLEVVVLGTAESFGGTPKLEEAYDPKSREHIRNGTYPVEEALKTEMAAFEKVLKKYGVKVLRPEVIPNLNQIFSRDIGFVIDDIFIKPRIIKNRIEEIRGIEKIVSGISENQVLECSGTVRIEGGDVMPWRDRIFVGYSEQEDFDEYLVSRTNREGVEFLQSNFPNREVHAFELNKSDDDPLFNALHLDCCFQPIGTNQAIVFEGGFKHKKDYQFLVDYFGRDNVIDITREEMYQMWSNVFSISPEVVVSESSFTRLNNILKERGFTVEPIPYAECAKMEGLLRCSTLPLRRKRQ